tara:strand:+ start:357 stop:530 length:174 start_codon:yes stop_codon:yes gene_type:complete
MASNPYKEDTLKDIEEMLLNDPTFKHDLVMGKYGYNPEERAVKVTEKIYDIYESMSF